MSDQMPHDDLLEQLRTVDPAPAGALERSLTREELTALRERAIRLGEAGDASPRPSSARRGILMPAGAVLAVAASVAIIMLFGAGSSGGGGQGPSFAAAAIQVAEANPRLLVTEPGWRVTRADEFEPDSGEIGFSDGTHYLQITWYPAFAYGQHRRDRVAEPGPDVPITVLGQDAIMIRYGGSTDFATMLPPEGSTFVEIRGDLGSEEAYREILGSLEQVDVETWLSAMPPSVVRPVDRGQVVDAMLQGVPIPPGLDLDRLRNEDAVLDRYHLGAAVTGAVSCEWLDRWVAATEAGDVAAAEESVEAMSTSRSWPILQEMATQGGWSQAVWHYAAQLERGDLDQRVAATETRGGETYEYGPAYATGLGCDSEYRRLVDSD